MSMLFPACRPLSIAAFISMAFAQIQDKKLDHT